MEKNKRLIVRQVRSTNGCTVYQKSCMRGLGLRRIRHTVDLEDTPSIRGMIDKVSHLLEVQPLFIHSDCLVTKKENAPMKFKFNIKENAIDSLNEALEKYEQGQSGDLKAFKFAITHLSHCIELVLKMYLQTIDENLVFSRCFGELKKRANSDKSTLLDAFKKLKEEGFDFEAEVKGIPNPRTVTVDQALSVVMCEVCGKTGSNFVDQEFVEDIGWMKELRNSIEHFQFEFTAKDVRLCIGRLVRDLSEFTDIFSLFNLEDEITKEKFHIFEILADEYEHALKEASIDVTEAKNALFKGVRPKHQMDIHWNVYTCPDCGNDTMIPNNDSPTGYRCTFESCKNEDSEEIEVDCDICGCPWPNGDMTSWVDTYDNVCPRCENPEAW